MPGWPLPAFCTASAASSRAVSTALVSRSVHHVGCAVVHDVGLPVGVGHGRSRSLRWCSELVVCKGLPLGQRSHHRCVAENVSCRSAGAAEPAFGADRTGGYAGPVTQTPVAPVPTGLEDGVDATAVAVAARAMPGTGWQTRPRPHRSRVAAYVALTKPRIIELLLVTTLPSMMLAAGGLPALGGRRWSRWSAARSPRAARTRSTATSTATSTRSCAAPGTARWPATRCRRAARWSSACVLGVVAVAAIGAVTNWLAGGADRRWRSRSTSSSTRCCSSGAPRRTSSGAAPPGCMPVLIGWAAVTGSLAWAPFVLFAVVFFWTPPHFWALAIRYRDDYARAGVPMLPVVAPPRRVAARDRRLHLADGRRVARAVAAGDRLGLRRAGALRRRSCCSAAAHRLLHADPARRGERQADAAVPPVEQLPGVRVRRGRRRHLRALSRRAPTAARHVCRRSPTATRTTALLLDPLGREQRRRRPSAVVGRPGRRLDARARSCCARPGTTRRAATQFLAWARPVAACCTTRPRWSRGTRDKIYLRDLAAAGVPVVPTTVSPPRATPLELPGRGEFVVKPSVGAGSRGAGPVPPAAARGGARARRARCTTAGRTVLVQPYLAEVDAAGETALIYLDGAFSHAIRKGAMLPGGTGARPRATTPGCSSTRTSTARAPSPAELAVGRPGAARSCASGSAPHRSTPGSTCCPARTARSCVELELIEPSLFLGYADGAADRFAARSSRRA